MKRILTREQYLGQYKKHYSVNEMIENEVNWGDSLVGRMINSLMRKAEIGYNLMKMKNIISLLKNRFETMHDDVQLSELPSKEKVTIHVSVRLQSISSKIVSGSSSEKVVSMVIEAEEALKNIKEVEGVGVIFQKLGEYKTFLLEGSGVEIDKEDVKSLGTGIPETDDDKVKELGEIEFPLSLPLPDLESDIIPKYIERYKSEIEILKKKNISSSKDIYKIRDRSSDSKRRKTMKEREVDPQMMKDIKKLYRDMLKLVHPDRAERLLGIDEKTAKELSQKVNNANEIHDMDGLQSIWKIVQKLLEGHEKLKEYESALNKLEEQNKKNEDDKRPKQLGTGQEVESNENYTYLSHYKNFSENKSKLKITTKEMTAKFEEVFTEDIIAEFTITQEKATELKKYEKSTKLIMKNPDHIIEIVRLFKRAWRIHTTSVIQSGRTAGKVSNSVFREYEHLGSGGGGSPEAPGGGPWRNIKLYDEWEDAVLDILADSKYKTTIFSDDCKFSFGSEGVTVDSDKKLGKILLNFITKLLADSKMYSGSGALPTFLKEYFGLSVNLADTAMTGAGGKSDNDVNGKVVDKILKTKVKFVDQRNIKAFGGDNLFEWISKKKSESKDGLMKGLSFRLKSGDKWLYFLLAHQEKEATYFYYLSRFGFNMENIDIKEKFERSKLSISLFYEGGKKMRFINVDGDSSQEIDNISVDSVEVLVDLEGKLFTKLKVVSRSNIGKGDFTSTSAINLLKKLRN